MVECCLTALVEAAESRGGGDWGGGHRPHSWVAEGGDGKAIHRPACVVAWCLEGGGRGDSWDRRLHRVLSPHGVFSASAQG